MPLTKQQASQIDWEALLTRLSTLRAPCTRWLNALTTTQPLQDATLHLALTDILSTLDYIDAALAPPAEGPTNAATT